MKTAPFLFPGQQAHQSPFREGVEVIPACIFLPHCQLNCNTPFQRLKPPLSFPGQLAAALFTGVSARIFLEFPNVVGNPIAYVRRRVWERRPKIAVEIRLTRHGKEQQLPPVARGCASP